jgi:DNA-directed RNA polymerase alpha subunit
VTKVLQLFKTLVLDESFYIKEKQILDLLKGIRVADIVSKGVSSQAETGKEKSSKLGRRDSKNSPMETESLAIDSEHRDYSELDLCIESFETGRKQMIVRAQEMSKRIEKDILTDAFS